MRGLGYTSVSTVANHIDNLIDKGFLKKQDNSARSLEVIGKDTEFSAVKVKPSQEKWLIDLIEQRFSLVESAAKPAESDIDSLYVMVGALKVLGFESASHSFTPRLAKIKKRKQ